VSFYERFGTNEDIYNIKWLTILFRKMKDPRRILGDVLRISL